MDLVDAIINAYFVIIGTYGFYLMCRDWRRMRKNAEEHKRRIREITDDYMKERER